MTISKTYLQKDSNSLNAAEQRFDVMPCGAGLSAPKTSLNSFATTKCVTLPKNAPTPAERPNGTDAARLPRLCRNAVGQRIIMRLIKKANLRIKGTGNEFVCPKDVHNELLKYGNVRIDGNNNKINIGGPNYLKFTDIKIFGNNNTLILPPGCYGKLNLEIRTSDAVVTVGHKTGFMGTDIILEEKGSRVIIGDDCMFAKETRLYCSDFHAVIDLKTGRPCNQGKEIVIGNHVWLGEGVKI